MRRDGCVEVQRFRYSSVGYRRLCGTDAISAAIPAYVLIRFLGTGHLCVAVVHTGKQRLVDTLVIIVVAVEA